jgi:hypothetical protein
MAVRTPFKRRTTISTVFSLHLAPFSSGQHALMGEHVIVSPLVNALAYHKYYIEIANIGEHKASNPLIFNFKALTT